MEELFLWLEQDKTLHTQDIVCNLFLWLGRISFQKLDVPERLPIQKHLLDKLLCKRRFQCINPSQQQHLSRECPISLEAPLVPTRYALDVDLRFFGSFGNLGLLAKFFTCT
jgi:hypothetical protein